MSNEVGSRLKEMRQRLKMTRQQLGEKLGNMEYGYLKVESCQKMAEFLKITNYKIQCPCL